MFIKLNEIPETHWHLPLHFNLAASAFLFSKLVDVSQTNKRIFSQGAEAPISHFFSTYDSTFF
jgi:hypothetical protein